MKKTILFFTLLSLVIIGCKNNKEDETEQKINELKNKNIISNASDVQGSFREIFKLYKDRVVFISTVNTISLPTHPLRDFFAQEGKRKETGLGSGFIVSDKGYICTNFHVIAPMGFVVDEIVVKINDKDFKAKIEGFDEINDIALLKIDADKDLLPVYFGNSNEVQVGDWAIAIGNPFGLERSFTVGVISAVGRKTDEVSSTTYLQTDVAINPGNSGGPLINISGEVIGINRMIYSKSGGSLGIGFAIPINSVKKIIEEIKSNKSKRKGFIGVSIADINDRIAYHYGLSEKKGAIILSIMKDGPAEKAGLYRGDLILEINGTKISSSDQLKRIIESFEPGRIVKIKFKREGYIFEKDIKIGFKKNF